MGDEQGGCGPPNVMSAPDSQWSEFKKPRKNVILTWIFVICVLHHEKKPTRTYAKNIKKHSFPWGVCLNSRLCIHGNSTTGKILVPVSGVFADMIKSGKQIQFPSLFFQETPRYTWLSWWDTKVSIVWIPMCHPPFFACLQIISGHSYACLHELQLIFPASFFVGISLPI